MTAAGADELRDQLGAQVDPAARRWLDQAVEAVRGDPAALARLFPAVGRHVGRDPLQPAPNGAGAELGWTVDDAGRVLLLVAAGDGAWEQLDELYRYGDAAERRAVLRSLAYLPPDAGGVGLGLVEDALRTNDPRLLAAALGPYAVERLPDEPFNQAILKCVFVGVPMAALPETVDRRASPALARMLTAYVRERVAAGRDVPPDVWPLIEAHPPLDELAAIEVELTHPLRSRRQAAAAALGQRSTHLRQKAAGASTNGNGSRTEQVR